MMEEGRPPRKDHVATYRKYAEMRVCAQTELRLLLAKSRAVGPTTPRKTKDLLALDIARQRQFLADIDRVMRDFDKALIMLSRVYSKKEYELFALLIIEGKSPVDVARSLNYEEGYIRNVLTKFRKDLRDCRINLDA